LQQIARTSKQPVRMRRAIVVMASAQGQPVPLICRLMQTFEGYVRQVIHDFNEKGFAAVAPKWTPLANSVGAVVVRHDRHRVSAVVLMEVVVSLRPRRCDVVPVETVRVARAVFPQGCLPMRVRDVLGPVFSDAEFAEMFSRRGQPAISPALLGVGVGVAVRRRTHRRPTTWSWCSCRPIRRG